MREIKFRSKTVTESEWLIGSLIQFDNLLAGKKVSFIRNQDTPMTSVFIETIGQFTSLKDRKGVEIYEGDIVQEYIMDDLFQIIFTDYANFGLKPVSELAVKNLKGHEYETIDPAYASTSLTVVGNIHDNPELLK